MESRRLLSPEKFAQVTGISVKTVRRRLRAGKLPADQSGGPGTLWLIDYDAFLQRIRGAAVDSQHAMAAGQAANGNEEKISGPRPKWTRLSSNQDSEGGYGPSNTK